MFPNVADLIHFSLAAFKQRKTQKKKNLKDTLKKLYSMHFLIEDFINVRKLAIFVKINKRKIVFLDLLFVKNKVLLSFEIRIFKG